MYKLKIVELPKPLNIKTQVNFPEVVLGKMQEKTVKPKTTFQEILPDKNYDGLSKVNVEAVTNEIDTNIKSENIKKDVSILGVQGNIEELKGTKLEITKNGTYIPEEPYNAFTEVDVNVSADVSEYFTETISGSTDQNQAGWINTIIKFPEFTIDGTYAGRMFMNYPLDNISIPDTSNITKAGYMFQNAKKLINIPQFNTSNMTDMKNMFYGCSKLISIPQLNTNKAINIGYMFYNCIKLTTIPLLNCNNVTTINSIFYNCRELTTLGGFENLGQAYLTTSSANYAYYTLDISAATNLTHDSLMNVINNLYDIATKGVKIQKLILGSANLAKLSDEEKAIATNKGWVLS